MNLVIQLLIAIACAFIVWRIFKQLQANPELLSKENIGKSFSTMGILALILIGGITILIFLLKHS